MGVDECFEGGQVGAFTGGGRCGRGSVVHKIAPIEGATDYSLTETPKSGLNERQGWEMKGQTKPLFGFFLTHISWLFGL